MKNRWSQLFTIALIIGMLPTSGFSEENKCPKNAYLARQEQSNGETRLYCKCLQGFTLNDSGQCMQCSDEYIQTLMTQQKAALEGIQHSFAAFKNSAKADVYSDIRSFIDLTEPDLAQILLALAAAEGKAAVAAGTAVVLIAKINKFWRHYYGCQFEEEALKTSCENTHRFTEIAESKSLQLKDCADYNVKFNNRDISMRARE
ncbi:MAG: hypothetical protein COW12_05755 [Candidatus Omnitrophica bacterium CG12_big_fil_rev_8_21_14_0_65_45_16]|nr:MAG: hypothetical protein COW12_05755 [Candidatus Omnitrophica bacterium CG12_big_fil_rev_8_21_14_0_65_45_16]